jgi:methyl-accepting chemotaxis protein/methyl-accepting chemotaxis protein-1 (serine sensor receptor)
MKKELTIGTKLALGLAVLTACVGVLSIVSLRAILTLGNSLDAAVNNVGKSLELVGGARDAFQNLKSDSMRAQIAFAIRELESHAGANAQGTCSMCHVPPEIGETLAQIQASGKAVHDRSSELRRLTTDQASRKSLDALDSGASQWVDYTRQYLELNHANRFDDAHEILRDKMMPILDTTEKAAAILSERQREALKASDEQARSTMSKSKWAVIAVIGFNLLMAAAMLRLVFKISAQLRNVTAELEKGAGEVSAAATQIASSSQALAQGATEQAASLEETSASSEEINSMAHRNTEKLRIAADLVTDTQGKFDQTETALDEMEASMNEINASSDKISKIIKVIDEIAFQTNILALNAAVEAARAGEAGMGFAVVAGEVRNLAQRCAQAARDTAALIEDSIAKSNGGKSKLAQVATAVRSITESASKIKGLVDDVKLGSDEQARGTEQVTRSVSQMEQVTQQSAAAAEQSAAAAEELNGQSESLWRIVENLAKMVGATSAQ